MDNHGLPRKGYSHLGSPHGGSRGSSEMGSRHGSGPALMQAGGAVGRQQEAGGREGAVLRYSSSPAVVEGVASELKQQ